MFIFVLPLLVAYSGRNPLVCGDLITLASYRDRYYSLEVSIGTPPQPFTLVIDPNQQFTFVAGEQLKLFSSRHRYDFSKSTTYMAINWTMPGEVRLGLDNIEISDDHDSLVIKSVPIFTTQNSSDGFNSSADEVYYRMFLEQPFDGLFGLQNSLSANSSPFSLFSLSLRKTCTNDSDPLGGALSHGTLDTTSCGEFKPIVRLDDDICMSISFKVDYVYFGNGSNFDMSGWEVVLATIPDIVLPIILFSTFQKFYNATQVGDRYFVPCGVDPGPFVFSVNGTNFQLNYADIIDKYGDQCVLNVRPTRGKEDTCPARSFEFVLGLPFLHRYCLSFDVQTKEIQAAPSLNPSRVCTYEAIATSTASTTTAASPKSQVSTTVIVVISVISAALLILVVILALFFIKYRRRISQTDFILSVLTKERGKHNKDANAYHAHVARGDEWEIDEHNLIVCEDDKMGSGAFANVFKGRLRGPQRERLKGLTSTHGYSQVNTEWIEVAVKISNDDFDDGHTDLIREIDFMKRLGSHAHVLSMLGCVTARADRPMLVMELCANGDLLHWLRAHSSCLSPDSAQRCGSHANATVDAELSSFAWQIADGLVYLASRNLIHRDIAARNVLLTSEMVAKISDFGLCRRATDNVYNTKTGKLPIKWMAPESLRIGEFTPKSDVWSYGVLLYELYSAGTIPFGSVEPRDQLVLLDSGERPSQPGHCPDRMFELMLRCWSADANARPSVQEVSAELEHGIVNDSDTYGYLILQDSEER